MALKDKGTIRFNYHETSFRLKEALLRKSFLLSLLTEEGLEFSKIAFVFTNDEYVLSLNRQFLNHDTYTDILTFTLSLPNDPIVSEIYISIDRVKENAKLHSTTFQDELNRVMIHGLLHLCGYDDITEPDKKTMRNREDFYLNRL